MVRTVVFGTVLPMWAWLRRTTTNMAFAERQFAPAAQQGSSLARRPPGPIFEAMLATRTAELPCCDPGAVGID